jgi:hypothetical protein
MDELRAAWDAASRQPQARSVELKILNKDPMHNQDIPLRIVLTETLFKNRESLFDQIELFQPFERWDNIFYCNPDSRIVECPGHDFSYSADVGFVWTRSKTFRADARENCKYTIDNYEKDRIFRQAHQGKILVLTLRIDRQYTHSPYQTFVPGA